jgi:energy-coupling factor transport system ATP-binding protein
MKLELRDVRYVYAPGTPFEVEALQGVSVVVEQGEVLAIVGGTGSGKSTLVQHMNLLLVPTSGEVLVDGVDATTLKKSELRRRVGLVFQFPESALFAPTVEEDVAFAPRQLGLDEEEVRERVLESLRALGAGDLAARSPFALSGGEKRRAAIAGVLAMRPEVLVLDEPTAGLDPATREDLLNLILRRLRRPRLPRPGRGRRSRRQGVRATRRQGKRRRDCGRGVLRRSCPGTGDRKGGLPAKRVETRDGKPRALSRDARRIESPAGDLR